MTIRVMTVADVPAGLRLRQQAGWNQLSADWLRMLDMEPEGCFVAVELDEVLGTVATCRLGTVAWIALLLVEEARRKQGIGTALLQHAIAFLEQQGVATIRLDATPLGRPLYEKLGFTADYPLTRYAGVLPTARPVPLVEAVPRSLLPDLLTYDQGIVGYDRRKMLLRLFREYPRSLRVLVREEQILGYIAARPGVSAVQIGPCLGSALAGPVLLADACGRFSGRAAYFDIPTLNENAVQLVQSMGLTAQRELLRMTRGPKAEERLEDLWLSSGPEKG